MTSAKNRNVIKSLLWKSYFNSAPQILLFVLQLGNKLKWIYLFDSQEARGNKGGQL